MAKSWKLVVHPNMQRHALQMQIQFHFLAESYKGMCPAHACTMCKSTQIHLAQAITGHAAILSCHVAHSQSILTDTAPSIAALRGTSGMRQVKRCRGEASPHRLTRRIQQCRCECSSQQSDQPQNDDSDGPVIELQQERQHSPRQQTAGQMHKVCVQQPCRRKCLSYLNLNLNHKCVGVSHPCLQSAWRWPPCHWKRITRCASGCRTPAKDGGMLHRISSCLGSNSTSEGVVVVHMRVL